MTAPELTRFGYTHAPRDLAEFGRMVQAAYESSDGTPWALGDLFNLVNEFGDDAYQYFDETRSLRTIQNYASVCRKFSKERRCYNLSFRHYDAVKGQTPEKQDLFLEDAVKKGYTSEELRHLVKGIVLDKPREYKTTLSVKDVLTWLKNDCGFDDDDLVDIRVIGTLLDE